MLQHRRSAHLHPLGRAGCRHPRLQDLKQHSIKLMPLIRIELMPLIRIELMPLISMIAAGPHFTVKRRMPTRSVMSTVIRQSA